MSSGCKRRPLGGDGGPGGHVGRADPHRRRGRDALGGDLERDASGRDRAHRSHQRAGCRRDREAARRATGVTLDRIRPDEHRLGWVGFEEGPATPKPDGLRAGRAPITIEAPTDTHAAAAIAYLNAKLPGARYVTRLRSAGKSADLTLTVDALATLLTPP
jgi:hypothetical protein